MQPTESEEIPESMEGYKVIGQLVADKVGLTKNILEEFSYPALNVSLTKYDNGKYSNFPEINEPRKFCNFRT